jgi:hypothetical protein
MGHSTKHNFFKRKNSNGHEKMLSISGHKGNANQNQAKIPPHYCWSSYRPKHHQQQMLARMWGKKEPSYTVGWECELVQPLWKIIWRLLKILNIDLPYDPATPLLGIYPKECNSGYSRGTCTPMFIAALFTIAKL